jgi:hypothetical protein
MRMSLFQLNGNVPIGIRWYWPTCSARGDIDNEPERTGTITVMQGVKADELNQVHQVQKRGQTITFHFFRFSLTPFLIGLTPYSF